jgi:predicted phosphodiesterase
MEEKLELLKKRDDETNYDYIKRIVYGKQVERTIDIPYEDLSELVFGDGNNFNESEVRKRFYGMKHLIEVLENDKINTKDDGVHTRILSISDLHVPFQLPIETFRDYVGKIDVLVLNGDIQDCQSVSKFSKKYRIPFVEEMIIARQYMIDLIEYIKPKKVVITRGNHEDRMLRMFSDRVNDDVLNLIPNSSLDLIVNNGFKNHDRKNKTETWYEPLVSIFEDIVVEYEGDWKCKIGKTWFIHPSAYSSSMLKTTEKAINYLYRKDRDFDTVITAHTHKLGSFIQGNVYMFEQGCCCKTEELDYMDGKLSYPQQKGFIYVCQSKDGSLIYDKTKLIALN